MERVKGIEPSQPAWKAGALPLSYTRISYNCNFIRNIKKIGGDERIRTTESIANGFTVRPIWPTLEHPHNKIQVLFNYQAYLELMIGLEPTTY